MKENEQQTELKKLEFLVGKWNTEGKVLATPSSPEINIKGTDTYQFLANGFFILHVVDVKIGDEQVDNVEIIYFNADAQKYPMRSFDNFGNFTTMHGEITDNSFVLTGDKIRSTLTYDLYATEMFAAWEKSEDGVHWTPWMELKLTK